MAADYRSCHHAGSDVWERSIRTVMGTVGALGLRRL
mgnify:CR=1 FL=1